MKTVKIAVVMAEVVTRKLRGESLAVFLWFQRQVAIWNKIEYISGLARTFYIEERFHV